MCKGKAENKPLPDESHEATDKEMFLCSSCGYVYPKTMTECPVCRTSSQNATSTSQRLSDPLTVHVKNRADIDDNAIIMPIIGRGMMPYVDEGQSVYIVETDHIETGDIGVVFLDDGRMVIRYLSEDGLCSLSPQWETFHVDPHTHYEVFGKVVGVVQPGDILDEKAAKIQGDTLKPSISATAETDDTDEMPKPSAVTPRRRRKKAKNSEIRCSFCGKTQDEVEKLIAGEGVYICNRCVRLCNEILDEVMDKPATEG